MKKVTIFLLAVFCLALIGCSKDAEVESFIAENNAVIKDLTQKIDANPTAAGIDEAQKAFDAKKGSLKSKWDEIKEARGAQVSADTQKKLNDSMASDMKMLTDSATKNAMKLAMDKEAMPKFQKLMTDYGNTFK
ncbi:MAG: hypothetical protein M3R14_03970 [Acidobacteriota bacterium]|nr:hypothetical protein [Acidobacteriota bacterium]